MNEQEKMRVEERKHSSLQVRWLSKVNGGIKDHE